MQESTKWDFLNPEIDELSKEITNKTEIARILRLRHNIKEDVDCIRAQVKRYLNGNKRDEEQYGTSTIVTDKKVEEFNWRDWIDPVKKMQELAHKGSGGQDFANWRIKTDKEICVLVLGDTQLGSWATNYDQFMQITDDILNIDDLYVILVGDLAQTAIKMRGVLEVMDNLIPPKFQMKFLDSWLHEIKHKVICSTWDNHCYVDGTEVLTKDGWVDFKDLKEGIHVAQFDDNGNVCFVAPMNYYSNSYDGTMYDIETNFHRQVVTENHYVVLKTEQGAERVMAKDLGDITAKDLYLSAGNHSEFDAPVDDDNLRLMTWVVTDGTTLLNHKEKKNYRVQFKLSKPRKIEALTELLNRMEVPYTIRDCKQEAGQTMQPKCIRIYSKWAKTLVECVGLGREKGFPEWVKYLSKRQLDIVMDTLAITDGCIVENSLQFSSSNKNNIDLIHFAATINGYQAWYKEETARPGYKQTKPLYKLNIHLKGTDKAYKVTKSSFHYSGKVHCLKMPFGTLITRYNGKVAFSGNSVMRQENAVGYSDYAEMFKRHTIYFGHIGHIDIQVGDIVYKWAVSHFFTGKSLLNPLHAPMRYMRHEGQDRDIAAQGDFHRAGIMKYQEGMRDRVAMVCGTIQTDSGYGKRFFSLKTTDNFPCVTLNPHTKIITPYWSVKEFLEARRVRRAA
jgi:hypothetical protein